MKHLVIIAVFLLAGIIPVWSQDGNLRFIRFADYNVEKDKQVQKVLKNERVTYTCIPSGILAIEVSPSDPSAETRITDLIRKVSGTDSFEFIPLTLEAAEGSCKSLRKPE